MSGWYTVTVHLHEHSWTETWKRDDQLVQVVLYFYPSDGSPGCTKQAAAFTENYDAFKKAGAVGVLPLP